MPGFRGLEPEIALHYSSLRKTKTGGLYQGWLGYGWGLAGFDVIERAQPRRRVPAYDGNDIFLIDGVELVACPPSQSPSCMAGGTHATQNESYLRVRFDDAANVGEVTDRTGTVMRLETVGPIAGETTSAPGTDEHDIAHCYRWLVTSVTDTHGNEVAYSYDCPELPVFYPQTGSYNGTEVRYYWQERPDYLIAANGHTLSETSLRIVTIAVTVDGGLRGRMRWNTTRRRSPTPPGSPASGEGSDEQRGHRTCAQARSRGCRFARPAAAGAAHQPARGSSMKRIALGAAMAVLAGPALAADPVVYEPAPAAPVSTGGFFGSITGAYILKDPNHDWTLSRPPLSAADNEGLGDGWFASGRLGYRFSEWDIAVYGQYADLSDGGISDSPVPVTGTLSADHFAVDLEVGYNTVAGSHSLRWFGGLRYAEWDNAA